MKLDELSFVALDFETATHAPESACALALVRVVGGRIVERSAHLIRPEDPAFEFTWVHGITWDHVADAPPFAGGLEHGRAPARRRGLPCRAQRAL